MIKIPAVALARENDKREKAEFLVRDRERCPPHVVVGGLMCSNVDGV